MKYWIIIGGVTEGPVTFDDLLRRPGVDGKTPVWRNGLNDWTYLENLPEWQGNQRPPLPDVHTPAEEPLAEPVVEEVVVSTPPPLSGNNNNCRNNRPESNHPWGEKEIALDPSKESPTYLGWCIASTLLCCTIVGIVAIIYSLRVRDENRRGYYDEARRDSQTVELWLIASITLGIVMIPFNIILAML